MYIYISFFKLLSSLIYSCNISMIMDAFFLGDCPAGSYSTLKNRTCILCPRGTYQPLTGRLSCISCGQNLTTTSIGTLDKVHCISKLPLIIINSS